MINVKDDSDYDFDSLNVDCRRFQELLEARLVDEHEPSDVDAAFLSSHQNSCAECGVYTSMLDTLESFESDAEQMKTVRTIVDAAFHARKQRRQKWIFGLAAAAAVAAVFGFLFYASPTKSSGPVFNLASGILSRDGKTFNQGNRILLGDAVVSPTTQDALIQIPDTVYLAMEHNARLRLIHSNDTSLKIALQSGRMAVYLVPDGPMDLSVELPWGTVDVTGTVFVVDAATDAGQVEVVRGTVAVAGKKMRRKQHLKAGWSLGLPWGKKTKRRVAAEDPLLALLGIHERIESVEPAASATDEEPPSFDNETDTKAKARQVALPKATLEQLLQEARACRIKQDWDCAVAKYRKAVSRYPTRPAAATAMVSAGQILLENMNAPGEALSFFRRYQKRRPSGGLGREALFGECSSLKALGRQSQERACLEKYLEKYPGTLYSKMARSRLDGIVKN